MDVVYPLKAAGDGLYHELKYSLRSLSNLDHGKVFIVGGRPQWVTNVHFLEKPQLATKYADAGAAIKLACETSEVSDPFILMNDDFFVMERLDKVPELNRGRVRDVMQVYRDRFGESSYLTGMQNTLKQLEFWGYEDPLSFELHVPIVVHKRIWLKAREMKVHVPTWHIRTAYGALAMMRGETIKDVKVLARHHPLPDGPFVSTSDETFRYGTAGRLLRRRFPDPSPYEK